MGSFPTPFWAFTYFRADAMPGSVEVLDRMDAGARQAAPGAQPKPHQTRPHHRTPIKQLNGPLL